MISRSAIQIILFGNAVAGVFLIGFGVWDILSSTRMEHASVEAGTVGSAQKEFAHAVDHADTALTAPSHDESHQHHIVSSEVGQADYLTPTAALSLQPEDDYELASTQPPVHLDSVTALMAHLDETPPDQIDFEGVVEFINTSHAAFDYVAGEYLSSTGTESEGVLFNALNNSTNPAIVELALELARSAGLKQRRAAYAWLSRSVSPATEDYIYDTLVDATYHEHDSGALAQLISSMPLASLPQSSEVHERAIARLSELAFHPDDRVSSKAIAKISRSAINPNTLGILQVYLRDGSSDRQLAALEGLRNFNQPTEDVMASLNAILHNTEIPQRNRAVAARVLIDFENQLSAANSL